MNFDEWFKKNYPGIELHPWQEKAIREFLFAAYPDRHKAMGKTFALNALTKFLHEHGNEYEL